MNFNRQVHEAICFVGIISGTTTFGRLGDSGALLFWLTALDKSIEEKKILQRHAKRNKRINQSKDIAKNPGPQIPDVRSFCKKMISLLIIKYWESKEGEELRQADYKRIPVEWPEHVRSKFGDPSKCGNETRNTMLKCLLEICIAEEVELPDEWLTLIDKYQTLQSDGCCKQKKQYVEDMKSWLGERHALEISKQLCDKLSTISGQRRKRVLELVFYNLKQHIPDLTSQSLQSQKTENEYPTPHGRDSRETKSLVLADKGTSDCSDPNALFTNSENNDKSEVSAANRDTFCNIPDAGVYDIQEAQMPSITGTGDFDYCVDLFGESSQVITDGWISTLPSPYADNKSMISESDATTPTTGSKRKLDLYDKGDEGQLIQPKLQNTSTEYNVQLLTKQTNANLDEERKTTLEDLMQIAESEMKTDLDDNFVPYWNDCTQESVFSDTEPSALMQELSGYLSDEFLNELSKHDSIQSEIANSTCM